MFLMITFYIDVKHNYNKGDGIYFAAGCMDLIGCLCTMAIIGNFL